uniref:Uncharacterized protein n=1 Tax=Syphacia muris TaxID=451379 RepID=A0A0N5AZS5_9BILA
MNEPFGRLHAPSSTPSPIPPSLPPLATAPHSSHSLSSSVCGSLRGSFRDLRDSLRELHLPRMFTTPKQKSVSAFSIALEMTRCASNHSPIDGLSRKRQCVSTGNIPRKGRRRTAVNWHNYTPQHLNKQFHLGKFRFLFPICFSDVR